jgi:hypothetical protein
MRIDPEEKQPKSNEMNLKEKIHLIPAVLPGAKCYGKVF